MKNFILKIYVKMPPDGGKRRLKKRQADYSAPLQPLTLAAFPPWEGSAGAGRVRPADCKYTEPGTIIPLQQ
jgi:hypothetical protein